MMKNGIRNLLIIGICLIIVSGCCEKNSNEHDEKVAITDQTDQTYGFDADIGGTPWVLDIEEATVSNENYRLTQWTGEYLQLVYMSLKPGEIINLEVHDDHDQFIRIEKGKALVFMGTSEDNLDFEEIVSDDWAILVPAGFWHKIENIGNTDLKLYTIYSPPEHQKGSIEETYQK
jgi:mannose-6-phosphate isomerase-like protein (cupin superfamily)